MTSAELTDWVAYERLYGPILAHDRIDIGFAQLEWLLARLWTKSAHRMTVRDFLPAWDQELLQGRDRKPDAMRESFEALMRMADNADD